MISADLYSMFSTHIAAQILDDTLQHGIGFGQFQIFLAHFPFSAASRVRLSSFSVSAFKLRFSSPILVHDRVTLFQTRDLQLGLVPAVGGRAKSAHAFTRRRLGSMFSLFKLPLQGQFFPARWSRFACRRQIFYGVGKFRVSISLVIFKSRNSFACSGESPAGRFFSNLP